MIGDTQHTLLRTVSYVCTDVEAALIWFGGATYAVMRGHTFTTRQDVEHYDHGIVGVYVDDREHGLMLLSMGFTP